MTTTPINPFVADVVAQLDENLREEFEERAAIIEYDAEQPRAYAEVMALLSLFRRHPEAFADVLLVEYQLNGLSGWLLSRDVETTRKKLAGTGAVETYAVDLVEFAEDEHARVTPLPREV